MNLFRLTSALGGLALLASGLSACLKEPSYSTTPEISFNSISTRRGFPLLPNVTPPTPDTKAAPIDTIYITINYQDGDGDLGLNQKEVTTTYLANPFNYFVQPFLRNRTSATHAYEPIPNGTTFLMDNGTFDHLTTLTDSKAAPIKGTLRRKLVYPFGLVFTGGDSVRFQVSILDRALHRSNVITTQSVGIPPR